MNPKEFFKRWAWGIKNLTPAQMLHSKIVGGWGNIIGLLFAWVFLWLRGFWFFSISMFFVIFILIIDLISQYQQYRQACNVIDELKKLKFEEADKNVFQEIEEKDTDSL